MALAFEGEIAQPFGPGGPRFTYGTAVPAGTFPAQQGDVVFNTGMAAGQPMMWVCTVAGAPGTWVPVVQLFTSGVPHFYSGTAAPASGTYVTGDIQYNSNPANGQPFAWVCVSGGTPGTWSVVVDTPQDLFTATLTTGQIPNGHRGVLLSALTTGTLPAAGGVTSGFHMFIVNSSAAAQTLTVASTDNIDGGTTAITLAAKAKLQMMSDGVTNWWKTA